MSTSNPTQSNAPQQLADAIPDIVYVVDITEQRNVFVNKSVNIGLGYSEMEISDMGADLFPSLIHPDDLPAVGAHYERIATMDDGVPLTLEYRVRHRDGHWLWLRSSDAVYERDADGRARLVVGCATDVTPLKEREDMIELLNKELAHRVQNLFSVNLSMIRLAKRAGRPLEETMDDLEQRISVLGRMHARVRAARGDDQVALTELVEDFFTDMELDRRLTVGISPHTVPTRLVTSLSLILYELYSHFLGQSDSGAQARLSAGPVDGDRLEIVWTQKHTQGKDPVVLPEDSRRLLGFAARGMGGTFEDSTTGEGYEIRLSMPDKRGAHQSKSIKASL